MTMAALSLVAAGIIVVRLLLRPPPPPPQPPLPPDTGLVQVLTSNTLRVALDASYPPFEVAAAGGSVHGFDVDLARAIADSLGVRVQFLNVGSDGLPDALVAGKADVVISSLHPDPRVRLAYSHSYYNAGQVLVIPDRDRVTTAVSQLGSRPVGVELGSDADEWLKRQQHSQLVVRRYDTLDAAISDLESGVTAGVITDAPTAADLIRKGAKVRAAGQPLTSEPYVVAAAAQNLSLIIAVNHALSELQASGKIQALERQDL